VNLDRASAEKSFLDELGAKLVAAVETMTGLRPSLSWEPAVIPSAALLWRHASAAIAADDSQWRSAGKYTLAAAGIGDATDAEIRTAFIELLMQVLPGGHETNEVPEAGLSWIGCRLALEAGAISLAIGIDRTRALAVAPMVAATSPSSDPGSFDLLLDVEMPVSISFGHAYLPLKEVLKLATGSVVELNRVATDLVDIVVNNCVIARGEVVVVEGNFGVRIQQVVSRQARLRTLE
jgi:flagellar motor switch protein FliN/FliY